MCDGLFDFIVNAANENLSKDSEVCRVIADRSGNELTKDGDNYARACEPIQEGEVAVTTTRLLPYYCFIYAIRPI